MQAAFQEKGKKKTTDCRVTTRKTRDWSQWIQNFPNKLIVNESFTKPIQNEFKEKVQPCVSSSWKWVGRSQMLSAEKGCGRSWRLWEGQALDNARNHHGLQVHSQPAEWAWMSWREECFFHWWSCWARVSAMPSSWVITHVWWFPFVTKAPVGAELVVKDVIWESSLTSDGVCFNKCIGTVKSGEASTEAEWSLVDVGAVLLEWNSRPYNQAWIGLRIKGRLS